MIVTGKKYKNIFKSKSIISTIFQVDCPFVKSSPQPLSDLWNPGYFKKYEQGLSLSRVIEQGGDWRVETGSPFITILFFQKHCLYYNKCNGIVSCVVDTIGYCSWDGWS